MSNISTHEKFGNKLSNLFGFTINYDKNSKKAKTIYPGEIEKETGRSKPVDFPSDMQRMWDWWLHQTNDTSDTLRNRLARYNDLSYMYYNDTIISAAVDLYADETVQFDSQSQPLLINAKDKKVITFIEEFFEEIGINHQSLREIAWNLALYGDSFMINSLEDGKGYTSSIVVDPTCVLDRLEFNMINCKKQMAQFRNLNTLLSRDQRLRDLADTLKNKTDMEDKSKYYKSYLFGFQLEENIFLAPWCVTHFRLASSKSEFYPYGRPLLINSISPFRQLKASKNLMAMARAAKFPKEHFEIKVSDSMTEAEKWNAINEAREEYLNLTLNEGAREDYAVGGQIWTPMDLVKYTMITSELKLDDIADIELLREDIIIGTRIPKGYLIVDRGSMFGASGQALLQQYKPFGRSVLTVQQAILKELVQMVKVHMIIIGKYDPEVEDFEINMHFPIIEDSKDRLGMKTDTLALAKAVVDSLSTSLGINSKLPTDVIKDIFNRYSFLDSADIETWIKQITDENEKLSESDKSKVYALKENTEKSDRLIRESYFAAKKKLNLREGIYNNRHYITSRNSDSIHEQILGILKNGGVSNIKKKLNEEI
jgi:hypothetical protein